MKKNVAIFVLLLVSLIIIQILIVLNTTNIISNQPQLSAKMAAGVASICINRPLLIQIDCPEAFNQSTRLEDWTQQCSFINLTHPFGVEVYLDQGKLPRGIISTFDNETLTLNITGNQTGVGNNTIELEIRDLSSCPIIQHFNLTFELLDINDPPELITEFPSLEIPQGTTLSAFFLDNYFWDPDGDPLTYSFTVTGAYIINLNQNTGEVRITNPENQCASGTLYFTATDPGNLSEDSNMITLDALCPTQQSTAQQSGAGAAAPSCQPKWQCRNWSECLQNGSRYRDCYDMNACNIDRLNRRFWDECEYQEFQEEEQIIQPPLTEEVDETLRPETPRPTPPIQEDEPFLNYVLMSILALSILTASYLAFRKQIRSMYAKIMWYLTKKQRQEILLSKEQKEELLKEIQIHEIKLNTTKDFKVDVKQTKNILKTFRKYFAYALNLDFEFTKQDTNQKVKKLIHPDLKNAFKLSIPKLLASEKSTKILTEIYVRLIMQQLRYFVLATSNVEKKDFNFKVKELIANKNNYQNTYIYLINAYSSLEFFNVDSSKINYIKILSEYEKLTDKEKTYLSNEIKQIYYNIKYVVSWTKKR